MLHFALKAHNKGITETLADLDCKVGGAKFGPESRHIAIWLWQPWDLGGMAPTPKSASVQR